MDDEDNIFKLVPKPRVPDSIPDEEDDDKITTDEVLERTIEADLDDVITMGTFEGDKVFMCSSMTYEQICYIIEICKMELLTGRW